ncbi:MAG: hypothetical protein E7158_02935 [Firmicutes bacterium]|nr:hypothetical protein [Bacillota bacterium]
MEELEKKLENLSTLFEEGKNEQELNNNIINFEEYKEKKEKNIIQLKDQNRLGTILKPFVNSLKTKKLEPEIPTKDEVKEIVEKADEIINDNEKNHNDNKLMNMPTQLIPIIRQENIYPLTVQKETSKALVLTKKAGSIFTSILITIVVLTLGIVFAVVLRG